MGKTFSDASILYWNSGSGIIQDAGILLDLLQGEGFRGRLLPFRHASSKRERRLKYIYQLWRYMRPFRVQIHLQHIWREQFTFSRNNLVFPNQEFFDPDILGKLTKLHAVCCKTHYAQNLFDPLPFNSIYTGFTSRDKYRDGYFKDYRKVLHVAGSSDWKGTAEVIELWKYHPEWPELIVLWSPLDSYGNPRKKRECSQNIRVINKRVGEAHLVELMNTCGIHLCPSSTEGFGHYIMEALSTGAIVITTDAPPMNELISSEYGYLAEADPAGEQFMSTLYRVRVQSLGECVGHVLNEPPDVLANKSCLARRWYWQNDRNFRDRFKNLIRRFI